MSKNLTIFDLDHTLTNCNMSFAFGKYLFHKGFFSYAKGVPLVVAYALQKAHLLSVHSLHTISFYTLFLGAPAATITQMAHEFIEMNFSVLLRKEMLAALERAKARGDEIWILSSSPEFLVREVSQKLEVTKWLATGYAIDENGRFKNSIEIVDGTAKWKYLKQFVDEQKMSLSQITAYSDSILDLPLLENVGKAVAVYPDKKLKKIAYKKSWEIIN